MTPERIATLAAAVRKGASDSAIARDFVTSRSTVARVRRAIFAADRTARENGAGAASYADLAAAWHQVVGMELARHHESSTPLTRPGAIVLGVAVDRAAELDMAISGAERRVEQPAVVMLADRFPDGMVAARVATPQEGRAAARAAVQRRNAEALSELALKSVADLGSPALTEPQRAGAAIAAGIVTSKVLKLAEDRERDPARVLTALAKLMGLIHSAKTDGDLAALAAPAAGQ